MDGVTWRTLEIYLRREVDLVKTSVGWSRRGGGGDTQKNGHMKQD